MGTRDTGRQDDVNENLWILEAADADLQRASRELHKKISFQPIEFCAFYLSPKNPHASAVALGPLCMHTAFPFNGDVCFSGFESPCSQRPGFITGPALTVSQRPVYDPFTSCAMPD